MSKDGLKSFDECPNRTTLLDASHVVIKCPKYPEGTVFCPKTELDYRDDRFKAARRIGCLGCKYSSEDYNLVRAEELLQRLHPVIQTECGSLFATGHYTQATAKGYLIVRDRVRELSGFEKASEAFGKGKLYINGSAAEHVDGDFQKGAMFLMMSIDYFRNEGSHTASETASDEQMAYERLNLCSHAMHLLDGAIIED